MRISARAIVIKDNKMAVMDRNKFGQHYLSLLGGALEPGEKPEEAVIREVREEGSIEVNNPRLVIQEDAGEIYGIQYIYLCDYVGGELMLDPESIEAKINEAGKNLYAPKWLYLSELANSDLLPVELKNQLAKFVSEGFPDKPIELRIAKDSEL